MVLDWRNYKAVQKVNLYIIIHNNIISSSIYIIHLIPNKISIIWKQALDQSLWRALENQSAEIHWFLEFTPYETIFILVSCSALSFAMLTYKLLKKQRLNFYYQGEFFHSQNDIRAKNFMALTHFVQSIHKCATYNV